MKKAIVTLFTAFVFSTVSGARLSDSGIMVTEKTQKTDKDQSALILEKVIAFADKLLVYGRDTYGEKNTPLFVNQIDVYTDRIPGDDESP